MGRSQELQILYLANCDKHDRSEVELAMKLRPVDEVTCAGSVCTDTFLSRKTPNSFQTSLLGVFLFRALTEERVTVWLEGMRRVWLKPGPFWGLLRAYGGIGRSWKGNTVGGYIGCKSRFFHGKKRVGYPDKFGERSGGVTGGDGAVWEKSGGCLLWEKS